MSLFVGGLTRAAVVAAFLVPGHTWAQQPDASGGSARPPSQGAASSPAPSGTAGNWGDKYPLAEPNAHPTGEPTPAPTAEAEYRQGLQYHNGEGVPQDYKEAARLFRLAAEQGYAPAQVNLGYVYYSGQGVPKDYKQAVHWYRLAAEQGNAQAQLDLGDAYDSGQGVPKDYKQAVHWYRLAAEQGYAEAQRALGAVYLLGQGVPKDYKESAHWYRLAAEQGNAKAQFALGAAYSIGRGVPKDYVVAYQWLNLAAASGDDSVSDRAARVRDYSASLMTPAQIAEGQRLSAQWQPRVSGVPSGQPSGQAVPNGAPAQDAGKTIFGTGFFVASDGRVLTNAHVVRNCASISVGLSPASASIPSPAGMSAARVLGRDATNDLALLATSLHPDAVPEWRFSVRQGEDIAIYGFPLAGLLASGGGITTGTIAALSGVNQDSRELQITAPIQPGNSGGPVFDRSGNIVGIVVAKLDALRIAQATEDIPENVGFAIKASVARDFLETAMQSPHAAPATAPLGTPDLAALARQITVQVVCQQ